MVRFLSFLGRKSKSTRKTSAALPREHRALPTSGDLSKSGLFGRLPFEIRYMIYVYALGANLLHLTNDGVLKKVGDPAYKTIQRGCQCYYRETEPYQLCLLQTCRQIYVEASSVLYSTNTFGIFGGDNLSSFCAFSRHIPRDRLEMITSICINCPVDDYISMVVLCGFPQGQDVFLTKWRQTWEILATQMVGLRDLEVRLVKVHFPPLKLTLQEDWVKPMLEVRGLRRFEFDIAQGIGSDESTAEYNERLEWFQKELQTSMCSAKQEALRST